MSSQNTEKKSWTPEELDAMVGYSHEPSLSVRLQGWWYRVSGVVRDDPPPNNGPRQSFARRSLLMEQRQQYRYAHQGREPYPPVAVVVLDDEWLTYVSREHEDEHKLLYLQYLLSDRGPRSLGIMLLITFYCWCRKVQAWRFDPEILAGLDLMEIEYAQVAEPLMMKLEAEGVQPELNGFYMPGQCEELDKAARHYWAQMDELLDLHKMRRQKSKLTIRTFVRCIRYWRQCQFVAAPGGLQKQC